MQNNSASYKGKIKCCQEKSLEEVVNCVKKNLPFASMIVKCKSGIFAVLVSQCLQLHKRKCIPEDMICKSYKYNFYW